MLRTRASRGARVGLAIALLVAAGCAGTHSLSSYARTGDTVMIAINGEGDAIFLRKEDLTAHVIDSNNVSRPVKVRAVINVYPDPTSRIGAEKADFFDYWGLRSAVIDLVDPTTGALPNFALGNAKLEIRRTGNVVVAGNVQLQILSGTGSLNPLTEQAFNLSWVAALEPRPQVRYAFSLKSGQPATAISAVDFELRIQQSLLTGVPETSLPQAVPISADQHLRFSSRHYSTGSTHVVRVQMVNPNGILTGAPSPADAYRGVSGPSTLRFAVAYGDSTRQLSYPPEPLARSVITAGAVTWRIYDTQGADVTPRFNLSVL